MPGMIQVKNTTVLAGMLLHKFDPKLVEVVSWIVDEFGLLFTESWRLAKHPGDLHSTTPVRAIDIRSWVYDDPEAVAAEINARWQYDPERPGKLCALLHDSGNGMHFHIQVHPRTIQKRKELLQ